jgi:hypothetical protein
MGVLGRRGTEGDWRAGRQADGGKLPQNDIARGQQIGPANPEGIFARWVERLRDTGLVHTMSSGLQEVPDLIDLLSLARQSLHHHIRHRWPMGDPPERPVAASFHLERAHSVAVFRGSSTGNVKKADLPHMRIVERMNRCGGRL